MSMKLKNGSYLMDWSTRWRRLYGAHSLFWMAHVRDSRWRPARPIHYAEWAHGNAANQFRQRTAIVQFPVDSPVDREIPEPQKGLSGNLVCSSPSDGSTVSLGVGGGSGRRITTPHSSYLCLKKTEFEWVVQSRGLREMPLTQAFQILPLVRFHREELVRPT